MHRSPLLGWIIPAVITVAIAGYVGAVVTGVWKDPAAAADSAGALRAPFPESTDPEQRRARAELCPLIDRPDVLELIERPATVKGVGTSYNIDGASRQCHVTLTDSVLRLNVSHDRLRVADYQRLFPEAEPLTVLGRPAAWIPDPSPLVNVPWTDATLLVAWDPADSGGTVELTIMRRTLDPRDRAVLTQIAERQIPGVPGWPG